MGTTCRLDKAIPRTDTPLLEGNEPNIRKQELPRSICNVLSVRARETS